MGAGGHFGTIADDDGGGAGVAVAEDSGEGDDGYDAQDVWGGGEGQHQGSGGGVTVVPLTGEVAALLIGGLEVASQVGLAVWERGAGACSEGGARDADKRRGSTPRREAGRDTRCSHTHTHTHTHDVQSLSRLC